MKSARMMGGNHGSVLPPSAATLGRPHADGTSHATGIVRVAGHVRRNRNTAPTLSTEAALSVDEYVPETGSRLATTAHQNQQYVTDDERPNVAEYSSTGMSPISATIGSTALCGSSAASPVCMKQYQLEIVLYVPPTLTSSSAPPLPDWQIGTGIL